MSVYQSDRQTVGKRVGMKKIPDKEMSESVHENVFRIPDWVNYCVSSCVRSHRGCLSLHSESGPLVDTRHSSQQLTAKQMCFWKGCTDFSPLVECVCSLLCFKSATLFGHQWWVRPCAWMFLGRCVSTVQACVYGSTCVFRGCSPAEIEISADCWEVCVHSFLPILHRQDGADWPQHAGFQSPGACLVSVCLCVCVLYVLFSVFNRKKNNSFLILFYIFISELVTKWLHYILIILEIKRQNQHSNHIRNISLYKRTIGLLGNASYCQ